MSGLRPDHVAIVRLPAQQWDRVLRALARLPFEEVAPLIGEIQRQCQMHEMQQRTAPDAVRAPRLVPDGYGPMTDGVGEDRPSAPRPPSFRSRLGSYYGRVRSTHSLGFRLPTCLVMARPAMA